MWSLLHLLEDDVVLDVVDIGASLVGQPPYQRLVDAGRARVTAFEPDPDECARLGVALGPSHRVLPLFVGDGREAVYHQTNRATTGSLFEPNTALLSRFWNLATIVAPRAEHRVATTRLDDVPGLENADFIKIDVQGAELDVFKHAPRVLGQALLIQTEVSFVELYKGQAMFADVDAYLRQHGFQYHNTPAHGYRSFAPLVNPEYPQAGFNQQLWADVYYVRDWMHLDSVATDKLQRYAVLLHDIVGSYDLAHVVLVEWDRRTGDTKAARYRQALKLDGLVAMAPGDTESAPAQAHAAPAEPRPPVISRAATDSLILETDDGIRVSVPATLRSITTYVLLEQECWFEKEAKFVGRYLRDGMTAIDIGANLGLYSLAMSRAVGQAGGVFAYEPGTANRQHLEASVRMNAAANITVSPCALSDTTKAGWLHLGVSGETNSLADAGTEFGSAEAVEITTLDAQARVRNWHTMDFVKIDAEGHEARIVMGGREFFSGFSPLVMYEIKNGKKGTHSTRWMLELLGYRSYRLTGDASFLVPIGPDEVLDTFELNLFSAKADRAEVLARQGLLAGDPQPHRLSESERAQALQRMIDQPYARSFEISAEDIVRCPFGDALVAYAAYLYLPNMGADRKYSALLAAFDSLDAYCRTSANPSALATYVRVARDLGYRSLALTALKTMSQLADAEIDQPFFPALARFDALEAGDAVSSWFLAAVFEQLQFLITHSSGYHGDVARLQWLCENSPPSAEILRRMILVGRSQGVRKKYLQACLDRLRALPSANAAVWQQEGLILGGLE